MSKDKKKNREGQEGQEATARLPASGKAAKSLQALSENPLVADVVAAALVSMAAALKDCDKARRLANGCGRPADSLSKKSTEQGMRMWDLALDVGRKDARDLAEEFPTRGKGKNGPDGGWTAVDSLGGDRHLSTALRRLGHMTSIWPAALIVEDHRLSAWCIRHPSGIGFPHFSCVRCERCCGGARRASGNRSHSNGGRASRRWTGLELCRRVSQEQPTSARRDLGRA